jgi:hypothetical protein
MMVAQCKIMFYSRFISASIIISYLNNVEPDDMFLVGIWTFFTRSDF